jgi:hypothetical protein
MRATVLLPLAGAFLLCACADSGPSVTANIPMTGPDGSIYYVKVVCKPAVTYSAPAASASVSLPSAGSATVKVDNAILQPTDQASRALDFDQYKACQDALLHPGTDSSFGAATAPPARPPVTTPELDTAAGTSNSGSANRDNAVMTVSADPSKVESKPPPADQTED